MKTTIIVTGLLAFCAFAAQSQTNTSCMDTKKSVSCKLTSPELQQRKNTVIAELKLLVKEKKELPDGFAYRFESSDSILDKLNEFIKTERQCCDFFTFHLTVDGAIAWLKIGGSEDAKNFLKHEIDF